MAPLIPLRSSLLPSSDAILPHLKKIDENRWYSNFGPLSRSLESRLAAHFKVEASQVLLTSSGTAALALSLLQARDPALDVTQYCMVPAYTFAAAAAAIRQAGLEPWIVDVDPETWSLTPLIAKEHLSFKPGHVAAVMPVSVFGAPLPYEEWEVFEDENSIPVIIDAAWAFDTAKPTRSFCCLSLHATKVFGVGEGGAIICRRPGVLEQTRRAANFGFDGRRVSTIAGLNGKMSEFVAAVGHSVLDSWPQARFQIVDAMSYYHSRLSSIKGLKMLPGFDGSWASAALAVRIDGCDVVKIVDEMLAEDIEARSWWNMPISSMDAYANCETSKSLDVTRSLCGSVVNIPVHHKMSTEDINRVCDAVAKIARVANRRKESLDAT